jgi:hypothetical protein
MDEYEKYLEKHIADMKNYPEENSGRSMLKMALHEYRAFKAKAVEATADGSLVALCWELLEMAENPDAIVARATEDSEAVYKSECFDFEKARQTLSRYRPASPAVEGLVRELMECLSGDNDYFMHLNGEAMKGRAFIPKKMIEEILANYDNAKGR